MSATRGLCQYHFTHTHDSHTHRRNRPYRTPSQVPISTKQQSDSFHPHSPKLNLIRPMANRPINRPRCYFHKVPNLLRCGRSKLRSRHVPTSLAPCAPDRLCTQQDSNAYTRRVSRGRVGDEREEGGVLGGDDGGCEVNDGDGEWVRRWRVERREEGGERRVVVL